MSRSVRQVGYTACLLLVALRIAIGWQFLYEGKWKLNTWKTAKPWTAEGYLANARGPFRETFRGMLDDPNGFDKLDYEKVTARWDEWRNRFIKKYPEAEKGINDLLDGPGRFAQKLEALPPGVDNEKLASLKFPKSAAIGESDKPYVRYNEKGKVLETNVHLLPADRDALLALAGAPAPEGDEAAGEAGEEEAKGGDAATKPWITAVKQLYTRTSKLSLKEKLQVLLQGDPDRIGVTLKDQEGTIDQHRLGKVDIYKHLVERYEANLAKAKQHFHNEHLDKQWREVLEKKAELIGPVDALTTELQTSAYKLIENAEMMQRGPVPELDSKIHQINLLTIWALILLGIGLMAGFCSRLSAIGAAGLLLLFYLPFPPWLGVPEPPGVEHSLFVNKNLIEFIACLALAVMPTGRWIGVDACIRRFVLRKKTD